MKSYLLKTASFLLLAFIFLTGNAQQAQTSDPKANAEKLKAVQVQKVNDMIATITKTVKITDEQKAKLQASLLESFIKSDNERSQINGDDTKLAAWRNAKIEDIKARVKAILTPAQYELAIKAN